MGIETFLVDKKTKGIILKNNKEYDKKYNFIRIMKKCMLIFSIVIPTGFMIYAYKISKGFVYLNDRYAPVGTKNNLFIWTVFFVMLVILLFFTLVLSVIYNNSVNRVLKEKYDETLVYEDDHLRYGYKLSMQSSMNDRVVVDISIDGLTCFVNKITKKITFVGKINSKYYTDYRTGESNGNGGSLNEGIVIYDYFSPSLIKFLEEQKVNIKYE